MTEPVREVREKSVAITMIDEMLATLDKQIAIIGHSLEELKQLRRLIDPELLPNDATIDEAFAHSHLACRISNCFGKWNWPKNSVPPTMLSDIAALTRAELLRLPNFGNKCYREIWAVCIQRGFWKHTDPRRPPP